MSSNRWYEFWADILCFTIENIVMPIMACVIVAMLGCGVMFVVYSGLRLFGLV